MISTNFGHCPINEFELATILSDFYSDVKFFISLFRRKRTKAIFITQNGVQKGLFSAANFLGIKTYEFQHGIVDKGHLIYSYPNVAFIEKQVNLPKYIFSFSDFWFKDVFLPDVNILPLGNDFFSKRIEKNNQKSDIITVVSADVFGSLLSKFLTNSLNYNIFKEYKIFFKLHPNQFSQKGYFKSKFASYPNIEVISNEYSIHELLEISETLLTIQSTAVYEALQAKNRVLLLKESTYNRHKRVFDNPNLHLVANETDILKALSTQINERYAVNYFSAFDENVLKEAVK